MPFVQKRVQMHCERLKMSRWVVIVNATYPKVKYEKFQNSYGGMHHAPQPLTYLDYFAAQV